ncbi:hypothetical protein [Peribacillus butanolivorans]|uniref:Lipoprotein n=1 Tax=Peribacillus butanolivorans TaxID=421767 RepID=A0ABN5NCU5_9BACI|nr:hypothetical protein [Peribacillus butanolivorans]AXN41011.1 hypothetical protein DTO10_23300 [Peribacillus butanolivorans]
MTKITVGLIGLLLIGIVLSQCLTIKHQDTVVDTNTQNAVKEVKKPVAVTKEKEPEPKIEKVTIGFYDTDVIIRGKKDSNTDNGDCPAVLSGQCDYADTTIITGLYGETEDGSPVYWDEDYTKMFFQTDDAMNLTFDNISVKVGDVIEVRDEDGTMIPVN